MRRFIRHPSEIPISYSVDSQQPHVDSLRDIGLGGLSFKTERPVKIGSRISLTIDVDSEPFRAEGTVVWSKPEGDHYSVGVEFFDKATHYSVRMVEQVCHIEQYRSSAYTNEGRSISSEQAAKEWVHKYAEAFPTP